MPRFAARLPQATMAIMVAAIEGIVRADGATMPMPTVAATAVPDIAPRVLKMIAMAIAARGVITAVDTTVAMALGASVQPFTNSAARTARRAMTTPAVNDS